MPPLNTDKRKEQIRLARLVEQKGFEMPSCSLCERTGRKCIVSPSDSSRCSECIRSSKKCDVQGPSESDWESLSRQKERLDQEEEEAMAKILRLRKQKRFLLKRESEMLRRGLRTLDELVEAEEKERLEKEKIEKERVEEETANVDAAPTPIDSSSFDFFDPSLPELSEADLEALLAGVGTSGGMPVASQGS
ncbi:hypothetical protein ACHAP3_011241 [Botrytis cinerea]|uniref:Putative BRTN n=1 Tax=Botryotinia fuckeliana TaxID=40559 RepID=C0LE46_BOTFU|nr:putative BRTN [Botrytis cinerea]